MRAEDNFVIFEKRFLAKVRKEGGSFHTHRMK